MGGAVFPTVRNGANDFSFEPPRCFSSAARAPSLPLPIMIFLSTFLTLRRCGLFCVLGLTSSFAIAAVDEIPAPTSTKTSEPVAKLDAFQVIGSRIKRLDDESIDPQT